MCGPLLSGVIATATQRFTLQLSASLKASESMRHAVSSRNYVQTSWELMICAPHVQMEMAEDESRRWHEHVRPCSHDYPSYSQALLNQHYCILVQHFASNTACVLGTKRNESPSRRIPELTPGHNHSIEPSKAIVGASIFVSTNSPCRPCTKTSSVHLVPGRQQNGRRKRH